MIAQQPQGFQQLNPTVGISFSEDLDQLIAKPFLLTQKLVS
jgi:hypothetical protein